MQYPSTPPKRSNVVLSVCFRVTELAFTRELSAKLTDEAKCQREVNRRRWWLFFSFFSPFIILSLLLPFALRETTTNVVYVCVLVPASTAQTPPGR